MPDLADRIVDYLLQHGPSKAQQIADALDAERSAIHNTLQRTLSGRVRQGNDYAWTLTDAAAAQGKSKASSWSTHSNLLGYYLDCLSIDDDGGVQVFADSTFDLDYVELESWPLDHATAFEPSEALRKLIARQRQSSRNKVLWLGYPVRLHRAQNKRGWKGTFLQPVILWPQDTDAADLAFLPEPLLNTRAMAWSGRSENRLEEAINLSDELGLDSPDLPPLDEIAARLWSLRPSWPWKDALDPMVLRSAGELRRVGESGIYNAAVVVMTERSVFTAGLERELALLRTIPDAEIASSSLGSFLGASRAAEVIDGLMLEPAPLNTEQRTAVRQALTEPLTIITGPPGTGKSQVVTALLVNAAWRGLRVLFASKNNQAVDVVMERVNALSSRPTIMRLGARTLQQQLAQHITTILTGQPTDADRQNYRQALLDLSRENEAIEGLAAEVHELIELRNRVDRREQEAEGARSILPPDVFRSADALAISTLESCTATLQQALLHSDRSLASFPERLLWPVLEGKRRLALARALEGTQARLSALGLGAGDAVAPAKVLAAAQRFLDAISTSSTYQAALNELSGRVSIGELSAAMADHNRTLARVSAEAWKCWTILLPDRLNDADRSALADYAAILRTISKAEEEGGRVAKEIWRRYYELSAKTTKALPSWAVTSLSVRGRVPFASAGFDLVIIDEASQCDIASALPLLFRAKRAVVIGDPQQLRHISRMSEQRDQALMVKRGVHDRPGPLWSYRASSLFDLAAGRARSSDLVVLRDHHRSHEHIIGFSNSFFYGGALRVATDYRRLKRPDGPAVRWVNVVGEVLRPAAGGAVNRTEAEAVVAELRRLAVTQRFSGEIGVVTPFRAQANLIEEIVRRDDGLSGVLASRNFISETAHRFQGDERDLILFSPVVSRNTPESAVGFLGSQGNLFNVGITRARGALVVVGDVAACRSSEVAYLSAFALYVEGINSAKSSSGAGSEAANAGRHYPEVANPEQVSDWERGFYAALFDAGLRPIPQFPVDQYRLDLALIRPNGRRLDIEIDGERYHRDWDGELVRRDQLRNLRLIEMGWDVLRLWVYEVRDHLPECIDRVRAWVEAADNAPGILGAGGPPH
ncbi:MAG: AAA domain-containing protein [Proteobacteria bacterium]|nr:AAA domain-containing protein [Pseudomonadota bacterium]